MSSHPEVDSNYYSYSLAGVRVDSNRPASLPTTGVRLCSLKVDFIDSAAAAPEVQGSRDCLVLPVDGLATLSLLPSGRGVIIAGQHGEKDENARLIRAVAPYAAALQGVVMLHAASVRVARVAWSFIGESGVGKSTLVRHLQRFGYPPVSDDLLAVRLQDQRVYVHGDSDDSRIPARLGGILFVIRDDRIATPAIESMSTRESLLMLLKHGFGDIPSAQAWRTQFEGYFELATRIPAFELRMPDDYSNLARSITFVSAWIGDQ